MVVAALAAMGITAVSSEAHAATWSLTGSMRTPRANHTATRLLDGRVIVVGGFSPGGLPTVTTETYDEATGQWTPAASMQTPRAQHTATLLRDGRVLVAGGQIQSPGGLVATATSELFDPGTGAWTPASAMHTPRTNFTATLLVDGRVLAVGGVRAPSQGVHPIVERSAEIFDPVSGTWTQAPSMVKERMLHGAVLLNDGRVLVAGGSGAQGDCVYTPTAEVYDPRFGRWHTTDPMLTPRAQFAFSLSPDGRALAAGGLSEPSNCRPPTVYPVTGSAEAFDPALSRWTAVGSLAQARRTFGWTALTDGSILIAGGRDADGVKLATSERLQPTAAWTSAGAISAPRSAPTLTALSDDRALLAGGSDAAGMLLASAEVSSP